MHKKKKKEDKHDQAMHMTILLRGDINLTFLLGKRTTKVIKNQIRSVPNGNVPSDYPT